MKNLISALWKHHRAAVLILIGLNLLLGIGESTGLLLLVPLLNLAGINFAAQSNASLPSWINQFQNQFTLAQVLLIYWLIITGLAILQYLRLTLSAKLQASFAQKLCQRLYQNILNSSWEFISHQRQAEVAQLLSTELLRVSSATFYCLQLASNLILLLTISSVALSITWQLALIVAAMVILLQRALLRLNKRSLSSGQATFKSNRSFYQSIFNQLESLKLIKSYAAEDRNQQLMQKDYQNLHLHQIDFASTRALTNLFYQSGAAALISLIFYLALNWLLLPSTDLLLILVVAARTLPRLLNCHYLYQQLLNLLPSYTGIEAMLSKALNAAQPLSSQTSLELNQSIELRQVSYQYSTFKALDQINLVIPAKQITVLLGPSGSGKSTLADILAGLLYPSSGEIRIDSKLCLPQDFNSWRKQVAYMMQNQILINSSVRKNLLLANADAQDNELWEVLEQAQIATLIKSLPAQLDTIIGDRGMHLSGGERQRLCWARLLLSSAQLLILDEPTNHLDPQQQQALKQQLLSLRSKKTILIITHQTDLVDIADQVYTLNLGQLIENNRYAAL